MHFGISQPKLRLEVPKGFWVLNISLVAVQIMQDPVNKTAGLQNLRSQLTIEQQDIQSVVFPWYFSGKGAQGTDTGHS